MNVCFECLQQLMINEITINSNNAIEMSRGELLNWVNELLKTNLVKIQQLGTGAVYCQLTDALYPGKLPMNKVNWKAKYDYEFVANFKILQQTFTKVGILKHIDVEKLVKCKYQDNLEMLQWFKKIYDTHGNTGKDYNAVQRRQQNRKDRENINKSSNVSLFSKDSQNYINTSNALLSSSKNNLEINIHQKSAVACGSFQLSDRAAEDHELKLPFSAIKYSNVVKSHVQHQLENSFRVLDSPWKDEIKERAYNEEREFYLRKFKEMEHLMEEWDVERSSGQLIENLRKIILVVPGVDWEVDNGEYIEKQPQLDREQHQVQTVQIPSETTQ